MRLSHVILALLPLATAWPHDAPATFSNRTVFVPPSNYTDPRVLYARTAELPNGDLLSTWENYSPEPPPVYFPIYKSTDGGYSWKEIARVQDQVNGWGLRYQPFLYVLPEDFGGYKAGDVLLAGNSIPTDLSKTQIDLYGSSDQGLTWKFISHIAAGGEAIPNNGLTPVWEPFLMLHEKKLICYYSDQRANTTHGQKLVHQTTTDLKQWGPVIDDVAYPTYTDRPGMTTVAHLPNGQYIMTYEYGGTADFHVYYRIAADPEKFNAAPGVALKATDGTQPTSSPYIVWSSVGGKNGTIIVSCGTDSHIFTNTALGQGSWKKVATPEGVSYSRSLRVLNDRSFKAYKTYSSGPTKLLIMGGGHLPPSTTNKITVSAIDISNF